MDATEEEDIRPEFYRLLDVRFDATPQEIKSAYRKLAKVYHPDKNKDGEAMFKKINRAHNILKDKRKRRLYDFFGEEILLAHENAKVAPQPEGVLWTLWLRFFGIWAVLYTLDYFTGLPFEWFIASAIIVFVQMKMLKTWVERGASVALLVVLSFVVWLLVPSFMIPQLANVLLLTFAVMFVHMQQRNLDISFPIWVLVVILELWKPPAESFHLLAAVAVVIVLISSLQFVPLFLGTILLYDDKVSYTGYFFDELFTYIDPAPLILVPVWLLIFYLDYLLTMPLEWLLLPGLYVFSFYSLISNKQYKQAGIDACIVLGVTLLVYFLVPLWFIRIISTVCLHTSGLVFLYIGARYVGENTTKIWTYLALFIGFMAMEFMYRSFPLKWHMIGVLSASSGILGIVSIWGLYSELLKTEAERREQAKQEADEEAEGSGENTEIPKTADESTTKDSTDTTSGNEETPLIVPDTTEETDYPGLNDVD